MLAISSVLGYFEKGSEYYVHDASLTAACDFTAVEPMRGGPIAWTLLKQAFGEMLR